MENSIIRSIRMNSPVGSALLTMPDHSMHQKAALDWFRFGFSVIPIQPHEKVTVVKWDPWLDGLSENKILAHWKKHPDHELGFIVSDKIVVLDADSQQSIGALAQIEEAFDVTPNLIIKTKKGVHHYFKLAQETFARTDSHSTDLFPGRIDVKARRSMVILPPSTGKETLICEAERVDDLVVVGQDFIDAVFKHNGRVAPRPIELSTSVAMPKEASSQTVADIKAMLEKLDPDCGREDWIHVGMAIYFETGGSEEGFTIWNAWSSKGTKYPGRHELRTQWDSFRSDLTNPITIATITKLVTDAGHDWVDVCSGEQFKAYESDGDAIESPNKPSADAPHKVNPLDKFSLTGKSADLEKHTVEEVPILGQIALKGQSTIIYAAPNTGKTLLTLWLIKEGIKAESIDPSNLFYLNMDDTATGLLNKVHLAEEYGFHMLAEGHQDFKISEFLGILNDLIETDQCRGIIIVLDTLKKFANLMDKQKSSSFTKVIRRFVVKGGTLIALAHTNKKPGLDGKPVYSGTTDIIDDSDCAYTLAHVSTDNSGTKVVEFDNIKRRGNVVQTAGYSYSIGNYDSYNELLLTVKQVDPLQLEPMKQSEQFKSDAEVIEAVIACIQEGINTKMMLAEAAAAKAGVSKRSTLLLIEKYTGNDPVKHKWVYTIGDRGAKMFAVLDLASPASA